MSTYWRTDNPQPSYMIREGSPGALKSVVQPLANNNGTSNMSNTSRTPSQIADMSNYL
jgi:hypothetical protein